MAKGDWWLKLDINEWLTDPKLRKLRRENRDSWLTACLMMRIDGEYQIKGTAEEIGNLLHLGADEFSAFLDDLKRTNAADVTLRNDSVTLVSRRYKREAKAKELTRLRVKKHRENGDVTPKKRDRVISHKKEVNKEEEIRVAPASPEPAQMVECKPADARKDHPVIVTVREATNRFPPKEIWDDLIDQVDINALDVNRMRKCYSTWIGRGFNKMNYAWLSDWYVNDHIPPARTNGTNRQNNTKQTPAEIIASRPYYD